MVIKILEALIALPKIGHLIRELIESFVSYQNERKRKHLEDARIALENAKTVEERREAIKRWSDAISS